MIVGAPIAVVGATWCGFVPLHHKILSEVVRFSPWAPENRIAYSTPTHASRCSDSSSKFVVAFQLALVRALCAAKVPLSRSAMIHCGGGGEGGGGVDGGDGGGGEGGGVNGGGGEGGGGGSAGGGEGVNVGGGADDPTAIRIPSALRATE